jgi:hypothetical protein
MRAMLSQLLRVETLVPPNFRTIQRIGASSGGGRISALFGVDVLGQFALQAPLGEHVLHLAPGGLLHWPARSLGAAFDDDQLVEVAVLVAAGLPEKLVLEVKGLIIALFHSDEFLAKSMISTTYPTIFRLRNIYEKMQLSTALPILQVDRLATGHAERVGGGRQAAASWIQPGSSQACRHSL